MRYYCFVGSFRRVVYARSHPRALDDRMAACYVYTCVRAFDGGAKGVLSCRGNTRGAAGGRNRHRRPTVETVFTTIYPVLKNEIIQKNNNVGELNNIKSREV